MSERQPEPRPDWATAQRIAELLMSLRKPGWDVYVDISVQDGQEPDWEYSERPKESPE